MEKLKTFAPAVLRIGMALVFIWFGTNQLIDTKSWVDFIPQSLLSITSLGAAAFVHINGVFEIVFGAALLLGLYTRFVAFILALHMLDIMFIVGWNSIGVRDFGLSIATISIWLFGADRLTLDRYICGSSTSSPESI